MLQASKKTGYSYQAGPNHGFITIYRKINMGVLGTLNDIKIGMNIIYNGEPHQVLVANFVRMQQRKPVMQTKMRNLITGKVVEYSFKPGEKVETGDLERIKSNFLYSNGDECVFMDNQSYEQVSLSKEKVGNAGNFLKEGCEVNLISFNNEIINVEIPNKIKFKIISAVDGVKGDSAQGRVTKTAEIETGYHVQVPLFIKEGEEIIINTETGEYVERA